MQPSTTAHRQNSQPSQRSQGNGSAGTRQLRMHPIEPGASQKNCNECGNVIYFVSTTKAPVSVMGPESYAPSREYPGMGENHFDVCPHPRAWKGPAPENAQGSTQSSAQRKVETSSRRG